MGTPDVAPSWSPSPGRREPFAEAIRTARDIVTHEGCALGAAAKLGDEERFEAAAEALARRIAQSLLEFSEETLPDGRPPEAIGTVDVLGAPPSVTLGCVRPK